ncbi:hypothetical protein U1Q18_036240 [Sarracenia purpurea var. burkii]
MDPETNMVIIPRGVIFDEISSCYKQPALTPFASPSNHKNEAEQTRFYPQNLSIDVAFLVILREDASQGNGDQVLRKLWPILGNLALHRSTRDCKKT